MKRKLRKLGVSIWIITILAIGLSGCTRIIYVPDPDCVYLIEQKDRFIEELMEDLNIMDSKYQDCKEKIE